MKKVLAVAALSLASFGANATDYVLVDVLAFNPFSPAGSSVCSSGVHDDGTPPIACGGTATSDGTNVSASGMQWDFDNANADFIYTGGEWNTTVGTGTTVTKSAESCTDILGTACSGLLGTWATGTPGPLNNVDVVEGGGALTITVTEEFAIAGTTSGNIFQFAVVPVPAAVWLFGSALGLLGFVRRRMTA